MKIVSTALKNNQNSLLGAITAVVKEDFLIWSPAAKPVFDMIEEVQPNVVLCEADEISETFYMALGEYSDISVVVFGVGAGENVMSLPNKVVICPPVNTPDAIKKNIGGGRDVLYLSESANISQVFNGQHDKKIDTDILYVSNAPLVNLPPSLVPTLSLVFQQGLQIKAVGPHPIPLPMYLGTSKVLETSDMLKSSKIVLDFGGTMLLDAAINKAFVISDTVNGLYPHYSDTGELFRLLEYYLEHPEHRKTKSGEAYDKVIEKDTSLHRAAALFNSLGLKELETSTLDKLEELV